MQEKAKKFRKTAAIAALAFALSLAAAFTGALDVFELKAFDLLSRNLNPEGTSPGIVIVEVDQKSIEALNNQNISWPWPRQVYAPIIEYLSEADAVFVDILFTEPSSYGVEDDLLLSEAVRKAGNTYFPVFLTNKEKKLSEADRAFMRKLALSSDVSADLVYSSAVTPLDIYKASVKGSGNVMIKPDEDGVYRRIPLVFRLGDTVIPNFVLDYLMTSGLVQYRDGSFYAQNTEIPTVKNSLMLRYRRDKTPFLKVSAINIISSYLEKDFSKKPSLEKEFFRGKKVFIGYTAPGLYELKPTSVSPVATGVHIHATTLDNILNRSFIRPLPEIYLMVFMFLICSVTSHFVLRHHSVYISLTVFSLASFTALSVPVLLFMNGLYIRAIFPLLSVGISFVFAAAYSYATEGKERRFIKRTFTQYMDSTIVEYILRNPGVIKPGGQRRRVSVFFADLAGFTSLAESLPPEQTAMILHTIFNSFTEVIIRNKGVVDKYIGDAIMAFWGAPLEGEDDEINACRAALQCVGKMKEINRDFQGRGMSSVGVRIGIHTGDAIAGNMGSDRLFSYTVIGDTVNLASRLESANKLFGTQIIISEATRVKTRGLFITREIGLIGVKGKSEAVRVHELLAGLGGEGYTETTVLFHEAVMLFNHRKPDAALKLFSAVLKRDPGDGLAVFYKKRCEELLSNPRLTEKDNWNIIRLSEK
ncbi:MAG: adenylate/guanylate cyclase domain-containing protein [Nitrospirota bacterium]|nr:adenylate/guanylate cyclase domain-containing protein [Nitrospirota bacterium]